MSKTQTLKHNGKFGIERTQSHSPTKVIKRWLGVVGCAMDMAEGVQHNSGIWVEPQRTVERCESCWIVVPEVGHGVACAPQRFGIVSARRENLTGQRQR